MTTPDFVVIGHVVQDLIPGGWRWGGTAIFAACQAQRLGLRTAIVTRAQPNVLQELPLSGVTVAGRPSEATTSFENVYEQNHRRQHVPSQAEPLSADDLPEAWLGAPIVLLGPVCGEVPPGLGQAFSGSLVAVAAQGWLRRIDRRRRVYRRAWSGPPFWSGCRALFISQEDLGRRRDQLSRWTAEVPIVAMTRGKRGATLHYDERWRQIDAFPARELDPTGAGDIFATAFLVRYHETGDATEAARFGSAAASFSVEALGLDGIAGREEIGARMNEHPEVVLR